MIEHGEIEKRRLARDDWRNLLEKGWVKEEDIPEHAHSDKKTKKRARRLVRYSGKQRIQTEMTND